LRIYTLKPNGLVIIDRQIGEEKRVKMLRAYGGCLGVRRRRRTWKAAISLGEPSSRL
jgi:hypothetical protein